jgi:hypothetical protein
MRHIGYIAEEVHELDTAFAAYNEPEGPPVGINWNGIQVYMLEEMKKLRDRIATLEAASGGAQSSPAGAASLVSVPTPLSSGEEAAPAALAEEPAAPAEEPADAPAE